LRQKAGRTWHWVCDTFLPIGKSQQHFRGGTTVKLRSQETAWLLLASGSAVLAAAATRALLKSTWRTVRKAEPPLNPVAADTSWADAVAWTLATGATVGVARLLARRGLAAGWTRAVGTPPPV
jgi:hypothetical protein